MFRVHFASSLSIKYSEAHVIANATRSVSEQLSTTGVRARILIWMNHPPWVSTAKMPNVMKSV